ncbi:MAG: hypothetical protein EX272_02045 [Chromatiales bacterium]|nr:MAG: hypothetical protein EX272_02045 [Chromatiales bacterium]
MMYLLAKFTLLFLLAAVLGFVLGYWWSKRRMVDVTESYEDLRKATARTDESQWERLWSRLDALPTPPAPQTVDLQPLHSELSSVSERIARIPSVDLQPIDKRLGSVETELARLGKRWSAAPKQPQPKAAVAATPKAEGPRLLRSADYGQKDDLKLISGVGPKLEMLLNQNGIYYFWQIASWSPKDVTLIDEKLDVFRGRISRDDWVAQAGTLKRAPDAARMPNG